MEKVVIYSTTSSRGDMVKRQYDSFKKFLKEDIRFVVLNNESENPSIKDRIDEAARQAGAESIRTKFSNQKGPCGPKDYIPCANPRNASERHSLGLKWSWENVISNQKERYSLIIDSDMFLVKPLSVVELLDGHSIAAVPQSRGAHEGHKEGRWVCRYFCPYLVFLDMPNLPDKEMVDWNCAQVVITEGGRDYTYKIDVAGRWYLYLESHPEIKLKGLNGGVRYTEANWAPPYDKLYKDEFLCNPAHDGHFFHYGASSNWNAKTPDYLGRKNKFVFGLIDDIINDKLTSWPWR
jgi:hypothetical protein